MISFGKCLMLFLRHDSSFGPSVDRIFLYFPLGRGGGSLQKGGAYLIFLASSGTLIRRGRANSSIYGICDLKKMQKALT